MQFRYKKTIAVATYILFLFLVACTNVHAAKMFCGQDLDGDGYLDSEGETAQCTGENNNLCPVGAVSCTATYSDPICPSGTTLNTATDKCEADPVASCATGYDYDASIDRCIQTPVCPSGGVLNAARDLCEIALTDGSCPSGFAYSAAYDACIKDVSCGEGGLYNPARDQCEASSAYLCTAGYTYNSSRGVCEAPPVCPSGFAYNATYNVCLRAAYISCPSGYTHNPLRDRCEKTPDCPSGGSYAAANNRCEASATYTYTCSLTGSSYGDYNTCVNNCSQTAGCTASTNQITVNGGGTAPGSYVTGFTGSGNQICLSGYAPSISADWSRCVTLSNATASGGGAIPKDYIKNITGSGNQICLSTTNYTICVTLSNATASGGGTAPALNYVTGFTGSGNKICLSTTRYDNPWSACITLSGGTPTYTCPYGSQYTCDADHNCTQTGTCGSNIACPSGYSWNGSVCAASAACSSGGNLDGTNNVCYVSQSYYCDPGYTYDSSIGACVASATCSSGGVLNTTCDVCQLAKTNNCPSGYTYNSSLNVCQSGPVCNIGSFDPSIDKCKVIASALCPSGYTFNPDLDNCHRTPPCPSDSAYSATTDKCVSDADHGCPSTTEYSPFSRKCEAAPTCAVGSYNPTQNKCYKGDNTCPVGNYQCINNGSGQYQCSPNICIDISLPQNVEITAVDDKMLQDDGERDAQGNCLGEIYIFTGRGVRCRTSGVNTSFTNCCSQGNAVLADSIGTGLSLYGGASTIYHTFHMGQIAYYGAQFIANPQTYTMPVQVVQEVGEALTMIQEGATIMEGLQSYAMATFLNPTSLAITAAIYLVQEMLFSGSCDQQDLETAMMSSSGRCHYAGSYCEEKWPLIGCVQRAKGYCCFNSKLARIIHEQGRPQLESFQMNMWGSAEGPSCRGFTAAEFQMLDFSRIDLSEYFGDIQTRAQSEIIGTAQDRIQQFYDRTR